MKNSNKKGFTIVELVIVIAVIAILAAVLIPTFSGIVRRAQISADVQLCKNLNTVLSNAKAEGRIPGSMYDVLYLINEAGYILENLNPTSQGFYYAWDQKENSIIYIQDDLKTVRFPEDYNLTQSDCWVTVGDSEEAKKIAAEGFNLYLENDIAKIELDNVVSVDTGAFKCEKIIMNGTVTEATATSKWLIGNFGDVKVNASGANVSMRGVISNLEVTGSNATIGISGTVGSYVPSAGVTSTVSNAGMIGNVTGAGNITNNGVISSSTGSSTITGNNVGNVDGHVIEASTKEDLESIRTQVGSGKRNFSGETIKLANDINLNGIAFQPISNNWRKESVSDTWFQGTFDGQGHTIQNFSNSGFSITGLNAGTNKTSVSFGESKTQYNEAVYGLFASVYNATIKNLKVTADINMMIDNANKYVGDSVGAIIGFGMGNVTIENCTVSGSVNAYDGVAAFVGRFYGEQLTFINCTNNANVTGARKTSAFVGTIASAKVSYTNCTNNGTIICLGVDADRALGATDITDKSVNGNGYYKAAVGSCNGKAENITGTITNNGTVKIGDTTVAEDKLLNN